MSRHDDQRPDPDQLLKVVQSHEEQRQKGRLKIFLGYAAGVGKTYAMLEAARLRLKDGVDVVIGYVETHKRAETEALVEGLEVIPRKQVEYRGVTLTEMDLDAVLARRPALVLVDELAHTNTHESRHLKRYHDVEELLDAGIDVYTTLNIQHLESLNDVVTQITGVRVRETIPDRMIDKADEIEVIDLPPDELRQRLKEGKVYVSEQAATAIARFFRPGNLNALRELTLRRTADRVGDTMRAYMQTHAIPGPWHAEERILVCISPSVLAERLIRSARRLADEIDAEWEAIYVETPHHNRLTDKERDMVAQALRLADELGAKTARLPGHSIADSVIHYARTHNITKIVVGKPVLPYLIDLLRGSMVDQLIRRSGNIDVYVISSPVGSQEVPKVLRLRSSGPWYRYILSIITVFLCTLLGELIDPYVPITNLLMLYLLAVVFVATRAGRGPALATALLSIAAFDFFFVPPRFTMVVADAQYFISFAAFLAIAFVTSALASQAREQAEAARRRQFQTVALYDLSRDLAALGLLTPILNVICSFVSQTFNVRAAVLLPEGDRLSLQASTSDDQLDDNEIAVADWAFRHGQAAGQGTSTLPAAEASYLPLKTGQGTVGVLRVALAQTDRALSSEQRRLLEASASLAALAIERAQLADKARQAQLMQETEKLQTALLNSISHDLRTPLATITGALSSLDQDEQYLDARAKQDLVGSALEQAQRLNRLVGNLLDMTRLEASAMKLVVEPADVQDLVGAALEEVGERLRERAVDVSVPANLPLVSIDFVLMTRVLTNVLDNAIKYSTPDSPIEIHARLIERQVEIEIADRGIGIPEGDLVRIFDKFYRVQRQDGANGTGLGLAISRGLVEAHGGRITAKNRPGGGTVVTILLPLAPALAEPAGNEI